MPTAMTIRTAGRAARAAALRVGHVLAALACLATGPALAGTVPLEQLIEEKARDSAGPGMPPRGRFDISVQSGAPTDALLISAWWNDPATGRFAANVVTDAGDVRRVNGLATLIVPVPVPTRRLMPGDIVSETDLSMIDLPASRIGAFTITDPAELVGMQVRSLLTEGRAVTVQAVMQPLVIGRGSLVSIRYSDGALELSAPGRALGDAHRGQEVRIVNLVSNTALVGIATAEGIVEVRR
jgi:flagella basal body P-ring formation protein FlgA